MSIVQTHVHHVFMDYCKFMVGNGSLTSFWLDNWIGDYPLKTTFPKLYLLSSSKFALVADMGRWSNEIWLWSLQWRRPLFHFEQEQLSLLSSLLESKPMFCHKMDKKIWTLNSDSLFSVKSCSKIMDQLLYGGAKPFQSFVWIKLSPPKVQLFLWLLVQDKVTTRDFLFQHDYITLHESRCAFCNKSLESSSHLFIHCHFTWNIWMKLLSNRGFCSVFPKSVDDMCYQWSSMVKGQWQNLSWQLLFSCVVWNLWLHRNDVIFNDAPPNLQICFSMVRQSIALWLRLDSNSLELNI